MELRSSLHLGVAIKRGAFGSPSTRVANFTYFIYVVRILRVVLRCTNFLEEQTCVMDMTLNCMRW